MVIVGISGPDGSGKTTTVAAVAERLRERGVETRTAYLYGCIACRRATGRGRAGGASHRAGIARRLHAVVDAVELSIRLAAAGRGDHRVLVTDRTPLDGLVKHEAAAGPRSIAGRLYRRAARRYRSIVLLDAPAALLAARDREHTEAELERLRGRFRAAAEAVPNVVHSPPTDLHAVESVLELLDPCLKTVRNG